ncbi:MAG: Ig-like domain-containing protein, partial [Ginsengibacter sp.]
PGSLSIVSGNNQSATANSAVSKPLVVLVKDLDGKPMSGVTVSWSVNSGGGQLIFPNSTTGANGEASNNWKLGPSGTQSVSASVKKSDGSNVNGSPVGFSATIQTETLHKIVSVGVGNFTDIGKVCPSYDKSATGIIRISFDGQTAPSTGAIKITHMWDNDGDGQFEGSNSGNTTDISSLPKTGNQVSITNGICWGGKKTVVKIEVQYINGTYSSNIVTSIVPRP